MISDKIYVGIRDMGNGYSVDISLSPEEGHSEYIRKDTLLEWLYVEKKKLDKIDDAQKDDVQMGASYAVEAFIEQINSL